MYTVRSATSRSFKTSCARPATVNFDRARLVVHLIQSTRELWCGNLSATLLLARSHLQILMAFHQVAPLDSSHGTFFLWQVYPIRKSLSA